MGENTILQQIAKSDTPSSSERNKTGKIRKATELYRSKPISLKVGSLILAFWGDRANGGGGGNVGGGGGGDDYFGT